MNSSLEKSLINSESIGRAKRLEDANARYVEFLKNTFPKSQRLDGLKMLWIVQMVHPIFLHH